MKYVLFIGKREKASFSSLKLAKAAARDDAAHALKWEHVIINPNTPGKQEWYYSNDRQDIQVLPDVRESGKIQFSGITLNLSERGELSVERKRIDTSKPGDYGADPIGNGLFRMVPSGDVVDFNERNRRLKR